MNFKSEDIILRPLEEEDAQKIAQLMNNRKIWDNLRDYIPSPYYQKDAMNFIRQCKNEFPPVTFAKKNNQILDEHRYAILKSDYLK